MSKTNYSYETSLLPYRDNGNEKKLQRLRILDEIVKGANNLLQISEIIGLPQSTISGRCGDLIKEGDIKYEGRVKYKDYTRKKIVLTKRLPTQGYLFKIN